MRATWLMGGLAGLLVTCAAHAACPPGRFNRADLDALKSAGFVVKADATRRELAIGLLDCLAAPDPALRDGIAFEAYSTWMRAKAIPAPTLRRVSRSLQEALHDAPDAAGFRQPFAALVLSEVARTDRIEPWMAVAARANLLRAAVEYMTSIRDYRGFDEQEGWRHGVAHGADLLMQLALNPALTRAQLDAILAAVASQIAPRGDIFYRYGESERLMRPVLFAASRKLHTEAEWSAWLATIASPAPLADWSAALRTQGGLAKKQNTAAFLHALYINVAESEDAAVRERMLPGLRAAVRTLP
ncbi:MAG: DUF2785 domain-containing protein [Lysobacterales bacterium]